MGGSMPISQNEQATLAAQIIEMLEAISNSGQTRGAFRNWLVCPPDRDYNEKASRDSYIEPQLLDDGQIHLKFEETRMNTGIEPKEVTLSTDEVIQRIARPIKNFFKKDALECLSQHSPASERKPVTFSSKEWSDFVSTMQVLDKKPNIYNEVAAQALSQVEYIDIAGKPGTTLTGKHKNFFIQTLSTMTDAQVNKVIDGQNTESLTRIKDTIEHKFNNLHNKDKILSTIDDKLASLSSEATPKGNQPS